MSKLSFTLACCLSITIITGYSSLAWGAPDLWGVDEDDGQLFKIEDYDGTPTFTDYGPLQFDAGGFISPIGVDIEAATLAPDGTLLFIQEITAVVESPMDLRRYPFDEQELKAI